MIKVIEGRSGGFYKFQRMFIRYLGLALAYIPI